MECLFKCDVMGLLEAHFKRKRRCAIHRKFSRDRWDDAKIIHCSIEHAWDEGLCKCCLGDLNSFSCKRNVKAVMTAGRLNEVNGIKCPVKELRDRFGDARMLVSDARDRDTAIKINILFAGGVPQAGSASSLYDHTELNIAGVWSDKRLMTADILCSEISCISVLHALCAHSSLCCLRTCAATLPQYSKKSIASRGGVATSVNFFCICF